MTIEIPADLATTIQAAVQGGRFGSVEEAMVEAARLLIRELETNPLAAQAEAVEPADPLLGIWHDYAEEMDEIVAEAYRQRRVDI